MRQLDEYKGLRLLQVNPVFRGRHFKIRNDLCFVLMPLHDPFTSIFEQNIKPQVEKCGLIAIKADDIHSTKPVMEDVWAYLNQATLVIADLTDSNPNVFYELGIAHTLGKEVIMIAQHITKIPFDVGHVRYINYVYPSGIQKLETELLKTITLVLKDAAVELRILNKEKRPQERDEAYTASGLRVQRLNSLTDWAREWLANNYQRLVDKHQNYLWDYVDEAMIFRGASETMRTEAVKRWGLSSSTAKDYAHAVSLTIEPEFHDRVKSAVAKWDQRVKEERRLESERESIAKEIFLKLEKSSSFGVTGIDFAAALMKTGKFTQPQAEAQLRTLVSEGLIYQWSEGYFRSTHQWSAST